MSRRVAVIGAGFGGLGVGALLSAAGYQVELFEQGGWLGGKCRTLDLGEGYQIDSGPAILSFPGLWTKYASRWNELSGRNDGANFLPVLHRAPGIGCYLGAQGRLDLPSNSTAWNNYRQKFQGMGEILELLLTTPPTAPGAVLPALKMLKGLQGKTSLGDWLNSNSTGDAHLDDVLRIQALNCGASPERAPALFAALPAILEELGSYIVAGGIHGLVDSLAVMFKATGGKLFLGTNVQRISANRIATAQGWRPYDAIVSAVDPQLTAALLQENFIGKPWPLSCSVYGLFGLAPQEVTKNWPLHQVVLPGDQTKFFSDLKSGRLSSSPMLFIHTYKESSACHPHTAKSMQGSGLSTVALLITVPAGHAKLESPELYATQQLQRCLGFMGEPKLQPSAFWHQPPKVLDSYYYGSFGHPSGALYGRLVPPHRTGPFHPITHQHGTYPWLFRAGAGVHPGGGIPGALGGAMIVAQKVQRYLEHDTKKSFLGKFIRTTPKPRASELLGKLWRTNTDRSP